MQKLSWDDLRFFLEVARSRTLSEAAQMLHVNQTTVSRRMSELEVALGVKLLERINRGWLLTSAGEAIVQSTEDMENSAFSVQRLIKSNSTSLSGRLSISTDSCLQHLVVPIITEFSHAYPAIELDYYTSDAPLNLDAQMADIAIRGTDSPPHNLIGNNLARLEFRIYGTREWLEKIKQGKTDNIRAVIWAHSNGDIPEWVRVNFPDTRVFHRMNSSSLMLDMIRSGAGIGSLGCLLGDVEPNLHRLPVDCPDSGFGVWTLGHPDLRTTARVRMFRDFVVDKLSKHIDLLEGRRPMANEANKQQNSNGPRKRAKVSVSADINSV
jgi:DNA-binding transcriptional LysR family regulator